MPITDVWTPPSALDRAINDILTETIWDNLVSNELYLYNTLFSTARSVSLLRAVFGADTTGVAGSVFQDAAGGLLLWGVTGSAADLTLTNNAGATALDVQAGTVHVRPYGRVTWN